MTKISSCILCCLYLEAVVQSNKSLLIIADDIEGEALTTLVLNSLEWNESCGCKIARIRW